MVLAGNKIKASDGLIEPDVQVFTSSGTWTKPVGAHRIRVRIVGTGGQGGAVIATGAAQFAAAAGGGGGGYCEKWYDDSDLNGTETVTIGSAGTAPAAGNNTGAAGGACTFKALTANGGAGGQGSGTNAAGNAVTSNPGAGGTASGGDINMQGESGQPGVLANTEIRTGSWGGGSQLAPRRSQSLGSGGGAGQNGQGYGGGGAGATNGVSQSARAGSIGATGVCIVETW